MPRIDQGVEVRDAVIHQVLSTSVRTPLTMTENDVVGSILKADGQKENGEDLTVSLWD